MRIGILTFHWATNYGAVMQCFALQTYLEQLGHSVEVIDYKPRRYDDSIYAFFRFRKFLHLKTYVEGRKKESALVSFRNEKLKQSSRIYSYKEFPKALVGFDAVISGSDQVLNPSFLLHGEGKNVESPTYFLGFPFEGKKIGYALSFGCVTYPEKELRVASKYIDGFDSISVREKTGVDIVTSMGRKDAVVVPDPTLLMNSRYYNQLAEDSSLKFSKPYIYSFFIRHISERKSAINIQFPDNNVLWNNNDGDYTMQGWLSKIKHAEFVVTDSFHCMVMCLKLHKPFAVITEKKGNEGMNDRFYTLLGKMSLDSVIKHKEEIIQLSRISDYNYDWEKVDCVLEEYSEIGKCFLNSSLS